MSAFHPIASKLGTLRDIRVGPILLQNDFGHRSEERFFQIKPEQRILN